MKPYFNMKVLTLGIAMALSAHSALAAPQHRTRPLQKKSFPRQPKPKQRFSAVFVSNIH